MEGLRADFGVLIVGANKASNQAQQGLVLWSSSQTKEAANINMGWLAARWSIWLVKHKSLLVGRIARQEPAVPIGTTV